MRHLVFVLLVALTPFCATSQKPAKPTLIPAPVAYTAASGQFTLNAQTRILIPVGQPDWNTTARAFTSLVAAATGYEPVLQFYKKDQVDFGKNTVLFVPDDNLEQAEGYHLDISPTNITVRARTAAGAFYAVQTLRQLFPATLNRTGAANKTTLSAPACSIQDYPRFGYRGLHLDVGRHWFPVDFVKRYIDLLAFHKMNRFHWHLTDDQGWRIEIKRYPRLQEVAACRAQTLVGHYSDAPERYDGTRYCHYYTQDEVRDVVEYARQRFVTVVPEIEMPGHALAALAAYPELGCTGGPYQTFEKWGVVDDVFCAGNDRVFEFLGGVLEEVCALFPGEYVHVGGDECPKDRWKQCPKCQARMKREHLKDEHELQSYVIKRAGEMLAKHGKRLIGWDEILEGGLAPSATVMSWRGVEGGIAAAQAGHDVVMTPGSHCYLDYYQSDPATEPLSIGGFLTLEKVYSYEPIPDELSAEQATHILGAQGNLWTEYLATPARVEYQVYPRACALAEVVWSPKGTRDWSDFSRRMRSHFDRLDALGVGYARSFFDIKPSFTQGKVTLVCADPSLQIRYTTDGSEPTARSTVYTSPFAFKKTGEVRAAAFQGSKMMSKVLKVNYLVHKASGKPYTLTDSAKLRQYTGGETYALTNGVTGGLKTWSAWVGLVNHDLDPTIDLGGPTPINTVSTHYVNSAAAWIHPPRSVEVFVSSDGKNFRSVGRQDVAPSDGHTSAVGTAQFNNLNVTARYLRVVATTTGVIPSGFPGAGEGAWLFLDEIVVD